MPLYVYGDVTVDNYEYFGKFSPVYGKIFKRLTLDENRSPPQMSERADHRIVARSLGGAHLLARYACMALSLWRNTKPSNRLDQLTPWAKFSKTINKLNLDILKTPAGYDDLLRLHYRLKESDDKCYRVDDEGMEGYTFPNIYRAGQRYLGPQTNHIKVDEGASSTAQVMLFNDGGLRYKEDADGWLEDEIDRLSNDGSTWAVIKARDPVVKESSPQTFIRFLTRLNKRIENRTIVCLNADDLRAFGVPIGRSLTWEKSLKDLEANICQGKILPADIPAHLVVTFDYDAVAYLEIDKSNQAPRVKCGTLIFSKNYAEGEFASTFDGKMPGSQSLFVSVFAALLYRWLATSSGDAGHATPPFETLMGYGLLAKRRLLECGFAPLDDDIVKPVPDMTAESSDINRLLISKVHYQEAVFALPDIQKKGDTTKRVPRAYKETDADRLIFRDPLAGGSEQFKKDLSKNGLVVFTFQSDFFRAKTDIFQYLAKTNSDERVNEEKFINYVIKDDRDLPVCTMGKLKTISGREIESLRTIRSLVKNYLDNRNERPIGLAVFGPPGTGKSFAVKTVFETLPESCKKLIEDAFLECNLSGLQPEDIAHFFQLARDKRLRGKVPVLFFDEFDCSVGDEPYFWLKHFLAPLQDGEFIAGHIKRPIGKSIFVFAGGANKSFAEFQGQAEPEFAEKAKKLNSTKEERKGQSATLGRNKKPLNEKPIMKGRDFLSRLQAHIDIMPLEPALDELNKIKERERADFEAPYRMRKAILLRGLLDQWAQKIFSVRDGKKEAGIDEDLVRDFLFNWRYKHGVRSMEAIIRMSSLNDERRFSKSCLPPKAQLLMHIHEDSYKD